MGFAKEKLPEQLSLGLTSPIDHLDLVHRDQKKAVVAWLKGRKPNGLREWHVLDSHEGARDWFECYAGERDVYFTPNEFYGWRLTRLLAGLNAIYLDFDLHDKDLAPTEMKRAVAALLAEKLAEIKAKGWPAPTAIVYTGRGFHLYWCIKKIPSWHLPRWKELTRHLARALGSDKSAVDCTRVLRMVGSVHGTTGMHVHGEAVGAPEYDFDDLYCRIFPKKAEVRDLLVARAKRGWPAAKALQKEFDARHPDESPARNVGSIYKRWYLVHQDLNKIVDYHKGKGTFKNGLPEGSRIQFLEIYAHALSWYATDKSLEDEIVDIARKLAPTLSKAEILDQFSTLISRAKAWAKWNDAPEDERGAEPPGRYKWSRQALWDRFTDGRVTSSGRAEKGLGLIPSDLVPQLRAIIPEEVFEERKKERDRARYADHNTGKGVREGNVDKQAQAHAMRAQKKSLRAIAKELDVALNSVQRWVA